MELKDIIKAVEEKELGADVIGAIKALDKSAEVERLTKDLEAEQGKSASILEDKKKFKERAELSEKKLKEIETSKLPEEERHAKELQELNERLESERAEREKQAEEFARTQREAKLADITGSVHWASGTPHETAKLIVSNAFKDLDLSDSSKVEEVLKSVKETHKSFIAAETPAGAGGKGTDEKDTGGSVEASSFKSLMDETWGGK